MISLNIGKGIGSPHLNSFWRRPSQEFIMRSPLKEKYGNCNWDCSSKSIRIIIIASIFSFVFVFVTLIHKIAWTPSSVVTPLLPGPSAVPGPLPADVPGPLSEAVPDAVVDFKKIWHNIKVKGADPNDDWFKGKGDGVIALCTQTSCKSLHDSCKPNKTFIPLRFPTPGGKVKTYVMSEEERDSFERHVKPSLTALMVLMARDPLTTLIDIGTDDSITSIAVASLGNHVLAVNPFRPIVQRLCNGIVDSKLTGKCYVSINAILDVQQKFRVTDDSAGGYVIGNATSHPDDKGGKRKQQRAIKSITLPDLLKGFSMTKAAIRLGRHNATKVLQHAEDFFREVDVPFIILSWFAIRAERSESKVYNLLKHNGFQPFSYNGQFNQLDPFQKESWPDNVIFSREENIIEPEYQTSAYIDVSEITTSTTDMVPALSEYTPSWRVADGEETDHNSGDREDIGSPPRPPGVGSRPKNRGGGGRGVDDMEESTNRLIM